MERQLAIYNTLDRKKELFIPLHALHAGMCVCRPAVYGDPYLGHARPIVALDLPFRYLTHIGYKIHCVRDITNVGHLEHDAGDDEDKIAKKACLERLESMEVAQYYISRYHQAVDILNVLSPSIEPHASDRIVEQMAPAKEIMENEYAYESEGSVYFDMARYNEGHHYGKFFGHNLGDVLNTFRELDEQGERYSPTDFALWKCVQPEHIMCWPSPQNDGFPGRHAERTTMNKKYPGENFDIHGDGIGLIFPYHRCEVAQSVTSQGHNMACYQMHSNMLIANGQKVDGSYGNFITLKKLFIDTHPMLGQAYSPMTIRFFALQTHYRNTVDFSNGAPQAVKKGLTRLMDTAYGPDKTTPATTSTIDAKTLHAKCYKAMNNDLNSPTVIAYLSEGVKMMNNIFAGNDTVTAEDPKELKEISHFFCSDAPGLKEDNTSNAEHEAALGGVVDMLLKEHVRAKANKDWATSDKIRNEPAALRFEIKDGRDEHEQKLNE